MCRPKEVAVSNPNHSMQTEERGTSGNDNEIEMESNPAYATCGVKCTADQGEVIHCNGCICCTKVNVCRHYTQLCSCTAGRIHNYINVSRRHYYHSTSTQTYAHTRTKVTLHVYILSLSMQCSCAWQVIRV